MTTYVFGIKDTLSSFRQFFPAPTDSFAERSFSMLALDKSTDIGKAPGDYELYRLAIFDDQTGAFENDLRYLCRGTDFVMRKEKDDE